MPEQNNFLLIKIFDRQPIFSSTTYLDILVTCPEFHKVLRALRFIIKNTLKKSFVICNERFTKNSYEAIFQIQITNNAMQFYGFCKTT